MAPARKRSDRRADADRSWSVHRRNIVPCLRNITAICVRAAARDVLEQLAVYNLTHDVIQIDRATTRIEGVTATIRDVAVDLARREDEPRTVYDVKRPS